MHHICIKEENNKPLPTSNRENLVIHKIARNGKIKELPIGVQYLWNRDSRQQAIPIFWEPKVQSSINSIIKAMGGTGICYVGHWKVVYLHKKQFKHKGKQRCAEIHFEFVRYDNRFHRIIAMACTKSCNDIRRLDFTTTFEQIDNDSHQDEHEESGIILKEEEEYFNYSKNHRDCNDGYVEPSEFCCC